MHTFRVDDMTCGHCASTITKAVRAIDAVARVEVRLDQHLVQIAPGEATADELAEAITEAGYTPVPVAAAPSTPATTAGKGCCGCGC
jgi:copper chaperone